MLCHIAFSLGRSRLLHRLRCGCCLRGFFRIGAAPFVGGFIGTMAGSGMGCAGSISTPDVRRNAHQNELLPVSATVNLIAAYAPGASRTLSCTDLHSGTPSTQVACLPFSQLLPLPAWCFLKLPARLPGRRLPSKEQFSQFDRSSENR